MALPPTRLSWCFLYLSPDESLVDGQYPVGYLLTTVQLGQVL
jgi:hypothetical protein